MLQLSWNLHPQCQPCVIWCNFASLSISQSIFIHSHSNCMYVFKNCISFKSKISHQIKTEERKKWWKYNINKALGKHISQPQQVTSLTQLLFAALQNDVHPHVTTSVLCSWLSSKTFSKWLAFSQSFSPSLLSLYSFGENILQQKQCKLSFLFEYISHFFSID